VITCASGKWKNGANSCTDCPANIASGCTSTDVGGTWTLGTITCNALFAVSGTGNS
jgi:hypothetical protein